MEQSIGKRIASLRKDKGLTQEELAEKLGISGQAVSKWENDQNYPDISILPQLARLLGVTVDELLSGKQENGPVVQLLPEDKRKDMKDMMLRIEVDSADGDRVRVNLPLALVQVILDSGAEFSHYSNSDVLKNINWAQVMSLIAQGAIGNLVEVDSSDGDIVRIFVE